MSPRRALPTHKGRTVDESAHGVRAKRKPGSLSTEYELLSKCRHQAASPLRVSPLMGTSVRRDWAAQRSDKAKLAVVGDRDAFCRVARFEDWASELAEPAESKVMTGPEFYQDCQSGCSHLRRQPINHHNVYQVVHLHLVPWLERVFGSPHGTVLAIS